MAGSGSVTKHFKGASKLSKSLAKENDKKEQHQPATVTSPKHDPEAGKQKNAQDADQVAQDEKPAGPQGEAAAAVEQIQEDEKENE